MCQNDAINVNQRLKFQHESSKQQQILTALMLFFPTNCPYQTADDGTFSFYGLQQMLHLFPCEIFEIFPGMTSHVVRT